MARRCELTGKSPITGHNISHSHIKTKRRQSPNIHKRRLFSDTLGTFVTLTLPARLTAPDLRIILEGAESLAGPWLPLATSTRGAPFTGAGYLSGDSATAGVKTVLIRDTFSPSTAPSRFLRIRVSR